VIFEDGKPTVEPKKVSFPDFMFHTVNVQDHPFPPLPQRESEGDGTGLKTGYKREDPGP